MHVHNQEIKSVASLTFFSSFFCVAKSKIFTIMEWDFIIGEPTKWIKTKNNNDHDNDNNYPVLCIVFLVIFFLVLNLQVNRNDFCAVGLFDVTLFTCIRSPLPAFLC